MDLFPFSILSFLFIPNFDQLSKCPTVCLTIKKKYCWFPGETVTSAQSGRAVKFLKWFICMKSGSHVCIPVMTSSNGLFPRYWTFVRRILGSPVNSPHKERPVTRSFDAFFDLHLNKRLSIQWQGWWFETPSPSLWRHCNAKIANVPSAADTKLWSKIISLSEHTNQEKASHK